jgi:F-box interacting protein
MARPEKKHRPITIPDDILVYEVLVRLHVKSLARFRCVCRSWRAGIADPAFVRRHRELSRAKPPSLLVIPREVDLDMLSTCGEISFHRLQPSRSAEAELLHEQRRGAAAVTRFIRPAHCDGLVAIATKTDRVFVSNPATRKFVALPPGSHNAELDLEFEMNEENYDLRVPPVAIGFDRWRNSYVVARYFYRTFGEVLYDEKTGVMLAHLDYDIGHEVFTLGAGGRRWEVTQDPPHAVGAQKRPICTRHAFYWHTDMPEPRLMRFGLRDRKFDVVPHPPAVAWTARDEMTELDGKLCYVNNTAKDSFQVWLADDEDALQWSPHCRIDLDNPFTYTIAPLIVDGDEMVLDGGLGLCRYDVRKRAMVGATVDLEYDLLYKRPDGTKYIDRGEPNIFYYVVPYFDSLVSPRACNY